VNGGTLFAGALVLWMAAMPAAACNPAPMRPPILEGHDYDATAAEYLLRDASSVVAARYSLKLDLELAADTRSQSDYVFEVLEGWKEETGRRLAISGRWVDCELQVRPGRVFLLYLDGERLLHAVPAELLDFEPGLLGEPDWYYGAGGLLVRAGESRNPDTIAPPPVEKEPSN
jgi:hypothetical protein